MTAAKTAPPVPPPETSQKLLYVRFRGDYACFCGPKKDEPVSYPCPTPSAARGMVEMIFWKPSIFWHVRRIFFLKPVRWFEIRVNELKSRCLPEREIVIEQDRDQRHILGLRDVDYVFEIHFSFTDRRGAEETEDKFIDMFKRRLEIGQCEKAPYLGRRDYPAVFEPPPQRIGPPPELAGRTVDVGLMHLDRQYGQYWQKDGNGINVSEFFEAEIRNGVLVEKGKDRLPFFACQGRPQALPSDRRVR
jgi:CRISPR-associated protein Cas5d